ncbi:helix-turn-helix protein [Paraburkholderia eburnea]|uniref:Helix-turn-helix protein n=1 Tax=Paraburkholderia eburnea TaxID=1189126 RepID=A0A2S4M9Q3_9BURK|nr:helix-turn-helix protein [Paraburkholderia eburnea]PRZ22503.1 helix-turn-helix protein [Paraburkholderia eburnea]
MAATERITMTMRELDRLKVIQDVIDGRLKPWRAAERLGLTTRQIRRLVGRLREHGPQGLVSRRRSKPGNNRLDRVTADRALSIVRERYADACANLINYFVRSMPSDIKSAVAFFKMAFSRSRRSIRASSS